MNDQPTKPSQPSQTLSIKPLFGNSKSLQLRIPDLQLHSVTTAYWRYFMSQVRCEVRLAFQANAIRVQIILPTGNRKNFHYRYETKLSFVLSQVMEFANYKEA